MTHDPYAGDRIAYMNARRGNGRKAYDHKAAARRAVDERARDSGDVFAECRDRIATAIANSRIAVAAFRFRHTRAGQVELVETIPF